MVDVVAAGLDQLHERIAGRFGRAEPRARVREYVSGLVAGLERKNGWTLAEWAHEVSPDGMQRLLRRADWDVDGVRDDVRAYVTGQLGEPGGVLIADDTGAASVLPWSFRSKGGKRDRASFRVRPYCPVAAEWPYRKDGSVRVHTVGLRRLAGATTWLGFVPRRPPPWASALRRAAPGRRRVPAGALRPRFCCVRQLSRRTRVRRHVPSGVRRAGRALEAVEKSHCSTGEGTGRESNGPQLPCSLPTGSQNRTPGKA